MIECHDIPELGFILMGFLFVVKLRSEPQAYDGHIATKWQKVIVMVPKMNIWKKNQTVTVTLYAEIETRYILRAFSKE